jgi:6-phosphofructokinase 2
MHAVWTLTMNPALDVSTSVERIAPTQKMRCAAARQDPGGGGINVARVISRLGHDVAAIFPIGGAIGDRLHQLVNGEGIQSVTIELLEETRQSFTVLEKGSGDEYRFVLPGPALSESDLRNCLEALRSASNQPGFIVMSGSLPPRAPDDFYARAARISKESGARVVLDTSGLPLRSTLQENVYLIKPNLRELRELTSAPLLDLQEQVSACRQLIENGQVEVVALTLGDQGALLVTRDRTLRAPSIPVCTEKSIQLETKEIQRGGILPRNLSCVILGRSVDPSWRLMPAKFALFSGESSFRYTHEWPRRRKQARFTTARSAWPMRL